MGRFSFSVACASLFCCFAASAHAEVTDPGAGESVTINHYICEFRAGEFQLCDHYVLSNGEYVVCGLPNTPHSVYPDVFFFAAGDLCLFTDTETVRDPAGVIEIIRTINADNPVKQLIPQEQRDAVKSLLKGFLQRD